MTTRYSTRAVFIILFAAIIGAGCFISIPLPGGVPITVQNMAAILAALVLGGTDGFIACALFLLAGLLGLPVFSGGRGGAAVLMGPTGGFLIGYAAGALATGLIAGRPTGMMPKQTASDGNGGKAAGAYGKKREAVRLFAASIAGFAIILMCGTARFMWMTGRSLWETLLVCVVPFLPGDAAKIILASLAAIKLRNTTRHAYSAA